MSVLPGGHIRQAEGSQTFLTPVEIGDADNNEFRRVEPLVGTRATFSRLPALLLTELGHVARGNAFLKRPDGTVAECPLVQVPIRIGKQTHIATCVWDDDENQPLMGLTTLVGFLLAIDPVSKELIPVEGTI